MSDTRLCIANDQLWQQFFHAESLSEKQAMHFRLYYELLVDWNSRMNLTAITNLSDIIDYHFKDSLALGHAINLEEVHMIADVGTGAGFPGIPLKIKYPHLHVILIEVVQKKIRFLQAVIRALGLENIEVVSQDWLTFLRTAKHPIDLFCARASLAPDLLIHVFDSRSSYKRAVMVYWASSSWLPSKESMPFLQNEVSYNVGQKQRKLVFLKIQRRRAKQCNVIGKAS